MTRMSKINRYAAELRALLVDQDAIEIARHYGVDPLTIDNYDHRIGGSIRELALNNREKWGEW